MYICEVEHDLHFSCSQYVSMVCFTVYANVCEPNFTQNNIHGKMMLPSTLIL